MPAASPVKRSAVEMGSGGVHDVAAKLPKFVDEAAEATQSLMHGLSAAEISNLMSKEGPIVKVVLLKEDGTQEELDADMSPKKSTPQQILGGSASFLGQFPELDLILMVRRENAAANLKVNQNKLPYVCGCARIVHVVEVAVFGDHGRNFCCSDSLSTRRK
mgnify:FL=1